MFGFDRTAEYDSAVFKSDSLNSYQHLSLQICRSERRCGICGRFAKLSEVRDCCAIGLCAITIALQGVTERFLRALY